MLNTETFISVIVVALVAWQILAMTGRARKISVVIREWNAATTGLVALVFGVLMGHWFWCG